MPTLIKPSRRLTEDQRQEIHDLHAKGIPRPQIAKTLGVSYRAVTLTLFPEKRFRAPNGYWKPHNDRRRRADRLEDAIEDILAEASRGNHDSLHKVISLAQQALEKGAKP